MSEQKRDLNNMNGITHTGKSCGINNMNCLDEEDTKTASLNNMNGMSDEKKSCGINDMNCLNEK